MERRDKQINSPDTLTLDAQTTGESHQLSICNLFVPVHTLFDANTDLGRNPWMVEGVSVKEDINEYAYCVVVNINNLRTYFYFG